MNKKEFLAKLSKALKGLNPEERKRQLDYYEEMINDRMEEGKTEEQAVWELGPVQSIAAKILSEVPSEQQTKKKKIGTVGWILIALAAFLLIGGAIAIAEYLDYRFYDSFDVEDMIEERLDLEGKWLSGVSDALLDPTEVNSIDVVWACGDVFVHETEDNFVSIQSEKEVALEYQVKDGVLYIETREDYHKGDTTLRIYVPEEILQLNSLNIVTTDGRVCAECELFSELNIVTASGDVLLYAEDCSRVNVTTASGNVDVDIDEDEPFTLDCATNGGYVDVKLDKSFVNESKDGKSVHYDRSFGSANAIEFSITTADGNIRLYDD